MGSYLKIPLKGSLGVPFEGPVMGFIRGFLKWFVIGLAFAVWAVSFVRTEHSLRRKRNLNPKALKPQPEKNPQP